MECTHKLSFQEILQLESKLSLNQAITYTCPVCGRNCELELKNELKVLAMALAVLLFIIVAAALFSALGGVHMLLNLIMAVFCVGVLAGTYAGMMYLYFRLGKFGFSAIEYHSIVGKRKPARK